MLIQFAREDKLIIVENKMNRKICTIIIIIYLTRCDKQVPRLEPRLSN